jgi:hypothetical protein
MKLREVILSNTLIARENRLKRLIGIAPDVMISREKEIIKELEAGKIEISGDKETLDWNFLSGVKKTGRGGHVYYSYRCKEGKVNYYPTAIYGRYIKKVE